MNSSGLTPLHLQNETKENRIINLTDSTKTAIIYSCCYAFVLGGGIKTKIMTKDLKFREELAELMERYDVEMYIDIEQDYAGLQSAELRFDTSDTYGSLVFSGWDRNVNCNDIRAVGNEA